MKKYRGVLILTSIITLLPIIAGCLLWNHLPDTMATHFSFDGVANGWSSKTFTVFGLPLILLAVHLICVFATANDPKHPNMSKKLFAIVLWICPIVSILIAVECYSYELGHSTNIGEHAMILIALLFIVMGNYLPKCRQNYTMGIKLPWTLNDEENWNHTHRMAGYLWILCGLVMFINAFMMKPWLLYVVVAVAGGIPTVYSYVYYLRHGKKKE